MKTIAAILLLATLVACSESDPNAPSSDPPIEDPPTVTEPVPKTGTGGETQSNPLAGGTSGSSKDPGQ
jgi:hypothetical protein